MAEPASESEQTADSVTDYKGPEKCNEKIISPDDEVITVGSDDVEAIVPKVDFRSACARCHKNFIDTKHNPKLLPCLHSLCDECVLPPKENEDTELIDDQGIAYLCPQCDVAYTAKSLLDNIHVQDLLKDVRPEEVADGEPSIHECTGCEEKETGTFFCIDCAEWLCDQCVTAHKRVRVTKDHKIVSKEDAPKNDSSKPSECFLMCKQHRQEKLMFFCEKCDTLTCRDCQLVEHKDHRYQFLDVAASDLKTTLQQNTHHMSERSKKLGLLHSTIETKLSHVKQQHAQIVKQVQDQADSLIKQIINNARQLLQDAKIACEAMARKLAKESTDLNKTLGKYDYCINFVDELSKGGSNLALLLTKTAVLNECSRIYSLPIEAQSVKNPFQVQYKHDNQFLFNNLNRFGAIYVNNQRFSSAGKNFNLNAQPPPYPYNKQSVFNSAVEAEKVRQQQQQQQQQQQHLLMSLQTPRMQSLLTQKLQHQQANQMQNSSIPPQVSSLVNQMRVSSQPAVNSWQVQGMARPSNQPAMQPPYAQRQQQQQQQPFQPMRLQHRPATQQSIYSASQHAPVNQNIRTSTNPHPQPARGAPPPLIPNLNQRVSSPSNSRPSSTGSSPGVRPPSSDNTLSSGVRIKQERRSSCENDCVITAAKVKGEPRSQPACSGSPQAPQEPSPSASTGARESSRGASPSTTPTHSGETEKNLEQVLDDLPIDELPSVEEINTRLLSSNNLNQHFDGVDESAPMMHHSGGKGTSDICMSDPNEDYCACCHFGGEVLCCDECPKVFHLNCHIPPLNAVPNGVFVCTLCSTGDNIRISSPVPDEMNGNGNKRKAPSGLSDKQIKVCERIMLELFCNSNSAAFHEPVSKQVPNYYKIIKNPMDFKTIKTKLARSHFNHYNCMEDFLADVKLVFQNCATYNQEHSEVGKAGKNVRGFFEELVARFLPPYLKFASTYPPRPQPPPPGDGSTEPKRPKTDESAMHIS